MNDQILELAAHLEGHPSSWDADKLRTAAMLLRVMDEWMHGIVETWHCGDVKPENIAQGRAILSGAPQPPGYTPV